MNVNYPKTPNTTNPQIKDAQLFSRAVVTAFLTWLDLWLYDANAINIPCPIPVEKKICVAPFTRKSASSYLVKSVQVSVR